MRSQLSSAFGSGKKQLLRRFKLLAFVARQIYPEISAVQGAGTVHVPNVGREIPKGVKGQQEATFSDNHDSYVFNLDLVSRSR